jgi:sporulation protein YlmC with PRC-barrel domain
MEAKMKRLGSAAMLALLLILPFGAVPAWAANPPEQTISSLPSGALPISDYYNQSVYDTKDNKIGDVNDLLVDNDGKVGAVIIGVGGFLGAGEKNVAVPFNALKLTDKGGKRYLVMDTTKEALEKAPGYTFDRSAYKWVPAKQG